ncbi:anthranilate phosphoribosyltransferase, TrpD [Clavulina sp. PMI_390]|nr:anthranilate phosphoribosyltransferase, TrpD [Clavulina sp. PMI_390]
MDEHSFKPLLLKLVSDPLKFEPADVQLAIDHLASPNGATPAQIGAFLTALKLSGLDKTPGVLSASATAMMRHSLLVRVEAPDDLYVDIVGTGGDGHNTFNVSTSAAIVAAGAGVRVIKHGNKASTSSSGSADILRALGCTLPAPSANYVIPQVPFTFLLASHYHPAMAALAPHRKSLPFRTLFNILGPLINPSRPKGMVLGVAEPALGLVFAQALQTLGVRRAMVVCGAECLDEISIAGPTTIWSFIDSSAIKEEVISPEHFGIQAQPLSHVAGGSASDNATVLLKLLTPNSELSVPATFTSSLSAITDFILINAAALLFIAGIVDSYPEGVARARRSIEEGKALQALNMFIDQV